MNNDISEQRFIGRSKVVQKELYTNQRSRSPILIQKYAMLAQIQQRKASPDMERILIQRQGFHSPQQSRADPQNIIQIESNKSILNTKQSKIDVTKHLIQIKSKILSFQHINSQNQKQQQNISNQRSISPNMNRNFYQINKVQPIKTINDMIEIKSSFKPKRINGSPSHLISNMYSPKSQQLINQPSIQFNTDSSSQSIKVIKKIKSLNKFNTKISGNSLTTQETYDTDGRPSINSQQIKKNNLQILDDLNFVESKDLLITNNSKFIQQQMQNLKNLKITHTRNPSIHLNNVDEPDDHVTNQQQIDSNIQNLMNQFLGYEDNGLIIKKIEDSPKLNPKSSKIQCLYNIYDNKMVINDAVQKSNDDVLLIDKIINENEDFYEQICDSISPEEFNCQTIQKQHSYNQQQEKLQQNKNQTIKINNSNINKQKIYDIGRKLKIKVKKSDLALRQKSNVDENYIQYSYEQQQNSNNQENQLIFYDDQTDDGVVYE